MIMTWKWINGGNWKSECLVFYFYFIFYQGSKAHSTTTNTSNTIMYPFPLYSTTSNCPRLSTSKSLSFDSLLSHSPLAPLPFPFCLPLFSLTFNNVVRPAHAVALKWTISDHVIPPNHPQDRCIVFGYNASSLPIVPCYCSSLLIVFLPSSLLSSLLLCPKLLAIAPHSTTNTSSVHLTNLSHAPCAQHPQVAVGHYAQTLLC